MVACWGKGILKVALLNFFLSKSAVLALVRRWMLSRVYCCFCNYGEGLVVLFIIIVKVYDVIGVMLGLLAQRANKFRRAFFAQENRLCLQSSPLRKVGAHRYMFTHKSYQEYFVTHCFVQELLALPIASKSWANHDFTSLTRNKKSYQKPFKDEAHSLYDSFLCKKKPYARLLKLLFDLIDHSKGNASVAILTTNSITLLNIARISLSDQNKLAYRETGRVHSR